MEGLQNLDKLVFGIEQKVVALRQIVAEEKRALEKFESTLQQEADNQVNEIEELLQACDEMGISMEQAEQPGIASRNTTTNNTITFATNSSS